MILFTGLLLLLPLAGDSQEYILQHRTLTIEDGLASRFVRKVIQDKQGFIWIATSEGLNRYDGEQMLYYNKEQHGLPATDINLLYEGPNGLLWVGEWKPRDHGGISGGGLKASLFDPIAEKAYSFREYFGSAAPFEEEDLFSLYIDDSHRTWIGATSGEAYLYDGNQFKLLVDSGEESPISYALPAGEDSFWFLAPWRLIRQDKRGNILEADSITGRLMPPHQLTFLRNKGLLLQGIESMAIKYPGQALKREYRLPNGKTMDLSGYWKIQEGPRGWLWCFTGYDLHVYGPAGQRVAALSERLPNTALHTFNPSISGLLVDADELAWIIPQENLLLLDIRENVFQSYLKEQRFSLRSMIQMGPDSILANTYKGLYLLNLSSGKAEPLFRDKNTPLYGMGAVRTPQGDIWIALHGETAAKINLNTGTLEEFPITNHDGIAFDPLYPFIDKGGKLWMGSSGGIAVFDTAAGQFVFEEHLNRNLGDKACTWLCESDEGIWAATSEGLFLVTPGRNHIEPIAELPPFYIFHIYREDSHRFWLSTRGGGLIRWDRSTRSFQQFTIEDGLSSNIIYAAYPDERGLLWLPSQNGLMLFDTASTQVQAFKELHGLPANEFNAYAHLRLENGRLLFGTIDGLAAFFPGDISARQQEETKLNVLKVEQFNSKTGITEDVTTLFNRQGFLELGPRRRFAVFRFFLNDYFRPVDNRFFYKIEGLDADWHAMTENQVPLGQMPWGKYTLRVRAIGQDGYRASNELAIPLYSIRPVYLRWWFLLAAILVTAALVALLFRWRFWRLKRSKLLLEAEIARRLQQIERDRRTIAEQKAHLEELNAAKDKLFSIIGHELRGPLMYFGNIANRISHALDHKQFDRLAGLGHKARNLAASTGNMLNNLLNWSLLESGRLSFGKGPADVEAVISQVMETYREVAGLKHLELKLDVAPGLHVSAGKDGLAILLQNLLSNAIKFTPEGGAVTVRATRQDGQAAIAVQDNGRGMEPEKLEQLLSAPFLPSAPGTEGERGAGLGLQIVMEILRRYQGELQVESREGQGSTFTLLLPVE